MAPVTNDLEDIYALSVELKGHLCLLPWAKRSQETGGESAYRNRLNHEQMNYPKLKLVTSDRNFHDVSFRYEVGTGVSQMLCCIFSVLLRTPWLEATR